ncbi:MAG TPA: response regulator transcription factor [Chryseolinea sp.]|nr:response regulator transcription factor [Chryseolinea sp.]
MPPTDRILCIAVDDEPPALDVIRKHIESIVSLELVAACNNAVEAFEILKSHPVDLLFLDIQMPQILGTDFIRSLQRPPHVIFTTAYRKFAVEGFELNAVDYLLKPISFSRFLQAVNKVLKTNLTSGYAADTMPPATTDQENHISFRSDRKIIRVAFSDILYIESLKDYIRVFTTHRSILTKQPISSLELALPKKKFIRIHRSYIVAIDKIDSYTADLVEIGEVQLPISRMYRNEVIRSISS